MDDGAGRYYGTLYGVLALLKSKGLASPEDMRALVGYADLASKSIVKVAKLSREISTIAIGYQPAMLPKPPMEKLREMHEELLEAVATLESMAGSTAIVDKIENEVSDHMEDMEEAVVEQRKSRFKVIDGDKPKQGDDNGSSDA
jgi:hypothetical protein